MGVAESDITVNIKGGATNTDHLTRLKNVNLQDRDSRSAKRNKVGMIT